MLRGCDTHIRDFQGRTALELAILYDCDETQDLLSNPPPTPTFGLSPSVDSIPSVQADARRSLGELYRRLSIEVSASTGEAPESASAISESAKPVERVVERVVEVERIVEVPIAPAPV